jgi:hypothetical protein
MNQIQSNVCMLCGKPHNSAEMVCLLCRVKALPETERNALKARLREWEAGFRAGRVSATGSQRGVRSNYNEQSVGAGLSSTTPAATS